MKKCPFCGGKPTVGKGKQYRSDGSKSKFIQPHKPGDWIWHPSIGCNKCRFQVQGNDLEELIAWWNKRIEKDGEK